LASGNERVDDTLVNLSLNNHRNGKVFVSSKLIMTALEEAVKEFITKKLKYRVAGHFVESVIDKAIDNGVVALEGTYSLPMPKLNPTKELEDKSIVGVDGGAFSLKLHPMRIVIARTGIFCHSQRNGTQFDLRGVWRATFSVLRRNGNIEEQIRRKIREILVSIESTTIKEIATEYGRDIDAFIWDGPLYSKKFFQAMYSAIRVLTDRAIICIKVVKNAFSSRIAKWSGIVGLTDADLFSYYLPPGYRTAMFTYDDSIVRKIPSDMRPVFFYVKTRQMVILRYEFPIWILEEYGIEYVLRIIGTDLALGNGFSYVINRADKIARFSEEEKRYLSFKVFELLKKYGFETILTFNEKRWNKYMVV